MTTTYNLPGVCPACGHQLDAATAVDGRALPKPDDLSICIGCTAFLAFNDDHSLRLLTDEDIAGLPDDLRILLIRLRRKIRDAPPPNKSKGPD